MTNARPISRIKINGFKSFKELDLKIEGLNIFIGANGAGKTNFIRLFRLFGEIVSGRFQKAVEDLGGASALPYGGAKKTKEIQIEAFFNKNGYKCTWEPSGNDRLIFTEEIAWFHGAGHDYPYNVHLGGSSDSGLRRTAKNKAVAEVVLETMEAWKVYHFHDTSDSAAVKAMGDLYDDQSLASDASNLAAFLNRLKNESDEKGQRAYNKIRRTVQLVAPFFDDFVLVPRGKNEDKILLQWRDKSSDQLLGPDSLSDGTLRFICLCTLLLQPEPPHTILIDEPELGLHPYAISVLAGLLRTTSKRSQIIATTQSVPLVNQFEAEDIIVIDRIDGPSQVRRLTKEDISAWIDEYADFGIGDLWEKNIIGGRP
jgi:predicted ATPase